MGFCFKNVSQSNGKKKRKRGKKVMKSICDSNSHVQILKTDFSTYILLPENPSSLWGALVKCPEVLKDWGWCMTLALNEHPWLKFHHRKSGATYSLKSDFLQPVFFIQAVSAASDRTESKSSALLLAGRGWAGAILFNGKGNQINPVQTQSLPSEEGWEVSGELLYIATFCCIYFPAAQSEDSKANPLCN